LDFIAIIMFFLAFVTGLASIFFFILSIVMFKKVRPLRGTLFMVASVSLYVTHAVIMVLYVLADYFSS